MTRVHLTLAGVALALAGCLPTDACGCTLVPPVALTTDRTEYTATPLEGEGDYRVYGFRVVARFTNWSGAPVYLDRCHPRDPRPMFGVRLRTGAPGLQSGYDPAWACVGHDDPIVVRPGATRTDTLLIRGPNAWDGSTAQPLGVLEGEFQLTYTARTCRSDTGCELPDGMSASSPFRVRVAR